eukprot:m.49040 g.49040  ORF g.49040 m.49040 type:complete len:356 (-) comp20927_c1_seq1:163-1230(-)
MSKVQAHQGVTVHVADRTNDVCAATRRRKALDLSKVAKHSKSKSGKSIMTKALAGLPAQPEYWGTLSTLYLCGNNLSYLPDSVGSLVGLSELWISDNKLSKLPTTISNLHNLVFLRANNNRLKSIPNETGKLRKLQKLHLGHNKLVSLPASICQLEQLRELLAASNEIVHLPEAIGDLRHLVKLHVNDNKLWRLPDSICWLQKLRSCRIDGNEVLKAEVMYANDNTHSPNNRNSDRNNSRQNYQATHNLAGQVVFVTGDACNEKNEKIEVGATTLVQNSYKRMLRASWTPRCHCIFGTLCNRIFVTVIMCSNRITELPPLMWEMIFSFFKGADIHTLLAINRLTQGSIKRRGRSL